MQTRTVYQNSLSQRSVVSAEARRLRRARQCLGVLQILGGLLQLVGLVIVGLFMVIHAALTHR